MVEGSLRTHITPGSLTNEIWAQALFPEFEFSFRQRTTGCEVFQRLNDVESKIGESKIRRFGLLRQYRKETLNFVVGDQSITFETRFFSQWIRYKGKRYRFLMQLEQEEIPPADGDDDSPTVTKEWRSFTFGESRLEHHDYENAFRIFARNEEEALLLAFIAFRFWADQYKES